MQTSPAAQLEPASAAASAAGVVQIGTQCYWTQVRLAPHVPPSFAAPHGEGLPLQTPVLSHEKPAGQFSLVVQVGVQTPLTHSSALLLKIGHWVESKHWFAAETHTPSRHCAPAPESLHWLLFTQPLKGGNPESWPESTPASGVLASTGGWWVSAVVTSGVPLSGMLVSGVGTQEATPWLSVQVWPTGHPVVEQSVGASVPAS
jgi:hypothetical protein